MTEDDVTIGMTFTGPEGVAWTVIYLPELLDDDGHTLVVAEAGEVSRSFKRRDVAALVSLSELPCGCTGSTYCSNCEERSAVVWRMWRRA